MTSPLIDEISAFAHLAHQLSRISVQYANWAAQSRKMGARPTEIAAYANISSQKRDDANWYLRRAVMRKDRTYG